MILALFQNVPIGAAERLFDMQTPPLYKIVDLKNCLGIGNIRDNFKYFPSHYTHIRSEIKYAGAF